MRQGHYACPELPPLQVQAFRVGGRLTGFAGARQHGFWVPQTTAFDVTVRPDARSLRTRHDPRVRLASRRHRSAIVAWSDRGAPGTRSLAGPEECVRVILRRAEPRVAFAVVESGLRLGILRRAEVARLAQEFPLVRTAGRTSESGGESLLLWDLRSAGLTPRQQVVIAGIGRVDMLLGERLLIEVDGAEFHTERGDFEEDRRRDAAASSLGYRTLRFSHAQVERHDPFVGAAIVAALARGDHR